jgi:hypothetical protein
VTGAASLRGKGARADDLPHAPESDRLFARFRAESGVDLNLNEY